MSKLNGLETNMNSSLRSMNNKIEQINDKIESIELQQQSQADQLSVVVSRASEKKTKLDKQQSLQWSFFNILHVVAAAGFIWALHFTF